MVHALTVPLSRCEYVWEVGRALEKLEKHLALPRATQRFSRALSTSCVHTTDRAGVTNTKSARVLQSGIKVAEKALLTLENPQNEPF